MICNYSMSHPADAHDVIGTAWHQQMAGSGRHTERMARAHEIRAAYEVPRIASPLNTNEVQAFVAEYEMAEAAKPHTAARVAGGVLGYKLVRHAMNRRFGR